jgi:hypothetical protein
VSIQKPEVLSLHAAFSKVSDKQLCPLKGVNSAYRKAIQHTHIRGLLSQPSAAKMRKRFF